MSDEPELESIALEFTTRNNLNVIKFAGKGAFKETFCVTDDQNHNIALKLIPAQKYNPSRSAREINALLKCETPLISKIYDFGEFTATNNENYYYSLEEYLDGGNLSDKIAANTLTIELIKQIATTLIRAIEYLKGKNLVHRDIKPDNIMFRSSSDEPVLVDLGIVRDLNESSLTQSWATHGPGTPYYSSPEQLNNDKHFIDWRSDQFSLGIVIGICLTGQHPFKEPEMKEWDVVQSMADRKTCSNIFKEQITSVGLEPLAKMLSPWPIQRYQKIDELICIFE